MPPLFTCIARSYSNGLAILASLPRTLTPLVTPPTSFGLSAVAQTLPNKAGACLAPVYHCSKPLMDGCGGRSYDSGKQVLQQGGKCLDASAPSELAMTDCNGAAVSFEQ